MDVRIGMVQNPKELTVELEEDTDLDALRAKLTAALAGEERVLWLTDRAGREVAVASERIAYVELAVGDGSRRFGFGA